VIPITLRGAPVNHPLGNDLPAAAGQQGGRGIALALSVG
jgi:hypothetical protein